MRVETFRLVGIRCFDDTGYVKLSPGCNIFVGQNNAGKSTLLQGISNWQLGNRYNSRDARPNSGQSWYEIELSDLTSKYMIANLPPNPHLAYYLKGSYTGQNGKYAYVGTLNQQFSIMNSAWPNNPIVPFLAKRKAAIFNETVSRDSQSVVQGTLEHLYARIDRVANPGPSYHDTYKKSVEAIIGSFITTTSSSAGKEGGFFYDDDSFITLDRMGDGVSELVALIVELSISKEKIFVLEEPETNLHPSGLKALAELIRKSARHNQFIIATHSNIVLRELAVDGTKVFRVYRDGDKASDPSRVNEVPNLPQERTALLRELGYEFIDFELHDAWLFLEESSAEAVINQLLIPWFVPKLTGRLRTFSAGGVTNVEASVSEFQRLVTFVHLQPVYQNHIWVRTDGDVPGHEAAKALRGKFKYLDETRCAPFNQAQFEYFFPTRFRASADNALAIKDKRDKQKAKLALLKEALEWSKSNPDEAKPEWEQSAAEVVEVLRSIQKAIAKSAKAP